VNDSEVLVSKIVRLQHAGLDYHEYGMNYTRITPEENFKPDTHPTLLPDTRLSVFFRCYEKLSKNKVFSPFTSIHIFVLGCDFFTSSIYVCKVCIVNLSRHECLLASPFSEPSYSRH
jgi:hypothetical protein